MDFSKHSGFCRWIAVGMLVVWGSTVACGESALEEKEQGLPPVPLGEHLAAQTERLFQRGKGLVARGRYAEAIEVFEQVLTDRPGNAVVYFHLAGAYFHYDEYPRAIQAYEKAIELDPGFAAAHFNLGSLYAVLERFPEALAAMRKAAELDAEYALAHNGLGKLYFRQGDYQQAEESLMRAVQLDSSFAEAWFNLGEVHFKQNELEKAAGDYAQAAALDSLYAAPRAGLGAVRFKQRRYAEAVPLLERAVRLNPHLTRAHFNLGNAYLRSGERKKGKEELELSKRLQEQDARIDELLYGLTSFPDDPRLYFELGVIHGQRGETAQARLKYEQAIARDSTFAPAYYNLGNLYLRARRPERALPLYQKAVEADSTYGLAFNGLGNVYMIRGEHRAALAAFRRALQLRPDDAEIRRSAQIAEKMVRGQVPEP